jgi:hypothetical protein
LSERDGSTAPEVSAKPRRRKGDFELTVQLGGVELTVKGWRGLATCSAVVLVAAVVAQELRLPVGQRTWHGHVFHYVPYDFRRPTFDRIRRSLWDPTNPSLFTDRSLGIGWSINLARLGSARKSCVAAR